MDNRDTQQTQTIYDNRQYYRKEQALKITMQMKTRIQPVYTNQQKRWMNKHQNH